MAWTPTPRQLEAIESTGRSVIVSAAAGSGKTTVLVERLIRQLTSKENPVPADRIIIVTFTKDAAANLRQKLNKEIQKKINEDSKNGFLLKQYALLQNAKISTIDSFCFDIIRNNAESLDITSAFSILDDTKSKVMGNQAIDETMNKWSMEHPKEYGLLYDRFCNGNDKNIKTVISEMCDFLESIPIREVWLEKTEAELKKENFMDTVYFKNFSEIWESSVREAFDAAEENVELIQTVIKPEIAKNKFAETLKNAEINLDCLQACLNFFKTGKIKEDFQMYNRVASTVPAKRSPEYKNNYYKYKSVFDYCYPKMLRFEKDIKDTAEVFSVLHRMLIDFYDILWESKCQKNAISFDDGEKLVIKMLSEIDSEGRIIPSAFAKELSEKFDVIMIDEYQDSNDKQDFIFKLLSKNYNPDDGRYGENVFLVGDIKQAIYRFRLANPDNFKNTMKSSVPYDKNPEDMHVSVTLGDNFRSSPEVINYVNYVFENLMSEKCGDVEYTDEEKLCFFPRPEYADPDSSRRTEITIINDIEEEKKDDYNNSDDDENKIEFADDDSVTPESEYIAEKIQNMIGNYEVRCPDGSLRKCEPSDFCILGREKKSFPCFIESLRRRDIPVRGEEKEGYLKSREIVILLDILRIIDNPLLDIPAAAVMMSPMFMFTSQDIAEIRACDLNVKLYVNIQKICEKQNAVSEELYKKCVAFRDTVRNFRTDSVILSVEELIEKIYDTTDFLSIMIQQFTDSEKKKANLRMLVQYAKSYEENASLESGGGLSGFLRYIDAIQAEDADLPQGKIGTSSENFVSIKTIHKSKGLEYPFVFLIRTDIYFKDDSKKTVICNQDNQVSFNFIYRDKMCRQRTSFGEIMYDSAEEKKKSEELRLLYVAMTRAKQKLFITIPVNKKYIDGLNKVLSEVSDGDIKTSANCAKNMGHWLMMTLCQHEKFNRIKEQLKISGNIPVKFNDENLFDVSCVLTSEIKEKLKDSEEDTVFEIDSDIVDNINKIMNFKYKNSERIKIPSKMSVTQFISDDGDIDEITLNQPRFIMENTSMVTGSERGTAIHKFFQFFDININPDEIEDELISMIDKNYFTEEEARLVPVGLVRSFLDSELYKRIKSASKIERERGFKIEANDLKNYNNYNNNKSEFLKSDAMLAGTIDLIIHEPDGLVIVDYKSDRGYTEKMLINRYSEQLAIYKSAVELIYKKPVKETLIYAVELQKIINL